MKVAIPELSNSSQQNTGKSFFCHRLAESLRKLDVQVLPSVKDKHDLSLNVVFIEPSSYKSKKVVRLDGIWHNKFDGPWKNNKPLDYAARNKRIAKSYFVADVVIYQTKFSKKSVQKYIGTFDGLCSTIFNGADPSFFDRIDPARSEFANVFFAHARWRPHKRLLDIIESFLLSSVPESCLYIAGDLDRSGIPSKDQKRYLALPNVKYLGILDQRQISSYLKIAKASLHLAWIDWCPNSVVESICAGVPVICNNIGGTRELVEARAGIVCDIDKPWDFKLCELYKPPSIDRRIVANAMNSVIASPMRVDNSHVHIDNVAYQYKSFFEKVLGQ